MTLKDCLLAALLPAFLFLGSACPSPTERAAPDPPAALDTGGFHPHVAEAMQAARQEVVDDLQAVWSAVERLSGSPIDPLDDDYLRDLLAVSA